MPILENDRTVNVTDNQAIDKVPSTLPASPDTDPSAGTVALSEDERLKLACFALRFDYVRAVLHNAAPGSFEERYAEGRILEIVDEFLDAFGPPEWADTDGTCDGKHPFPPCQAVECYRDRICPTCAGEGSSSEGTCSSCHGRGTVDVTIVDLPLEAPDASP